MREQSVADQARERDPRGKAREARAEECFEQGFKGQRARYGEGGPGVEEPRNHCTGVGELERWPIFICYRQADGAVTARRLHEMLDKREVDGPEGKRILLDVYLDETMPAVADWRKL